MPEAPPPADSGSGRAREEALPAPVRRYLERTLPPAASLPRLVRVTQAGEMRSKPDGRWLPFEAVQEFEVARVAFAWRARFRPAPLVRLAVLDSFEAGEGRLLARLWGLVPVMRARGPEVARGQAIRYLAELVWAPHAILANPELEWRELDARGVEVATGVGSSRVAVRLDFDAAGDVVGASTEARPRTEGGRVLETPWTGVFSDHEVVGGVRIPSRGEVRWELPDGPFTYWRGTITSLETG